MNWDDFRLVHVIAESRSLVGAAQILGINHSTIFRRLGQIEARIGKALFERSRSGYAPTQAGDDMIKLAQAMAEGVLQFERRIAGKDDRPSGLLRITTTDSFFYSLLAPILGDFSILYPDIELDIVISSEELNLARHDADIALRVTRDPEPEPFLVGRKIAQLGLGVYARVDSKWATTDPFGAQACVIGFGGFLEQCEPARWMSSHMPRARRVARSNTMLMTAQAAATGLGFAVLPHIVAHATPNLVLRHAIPDSKLSLWLLTHGDLKNSARVRAFMDHAWPILTRKRPLIMGLPTFEIVAAIPQI